MTYFKKFETIQYLLEGNTKETQNIIQAVLPRRLNVDKTFVFQRYDVASGERPEQTADIMYKDPNLWWVPMVVNNMVCPYIDWRMSDEELEAYTKIIYSKIGQTEDDIHHFFNLNKERIVDEVDDAIFRAMDPNSIPAHIRPVSNFAHENELNLERGKIVVISSKYVSQFVDSYIKALEGRN